MKKFIAGAVLMAFVLSGCSTENKTAAKNEEIITCVSGSYYIRPSYSVHPCIFKDTETGQEYIVFTYNKDITVIPRLPKEKL